MRDLRDPQKLGEFLLRNKRPNRPISLVADELKEYPIPDYDHGESLATVTAREYRDELERRAADGDRYAKSLLDGHRGDPEIV